MKKLYFTFLFLAGGSVFGQNVLTVNPGAVLSTSGGVVVTLSDMDLVVNGTIRQTTGQGTFLFSGTADNSIWGAAAPFFDTLRIAKTGSGRLVLRQMVDVASAVQFGGGLIDLNGNTLNLQPTALLNGESGSSRIVGPAGGYVQITVPLNAPSAVNPGNLGAVISTAADMGPTVIRRGHVSQVNGSGGGSSTLRYYDINPTNDAGLDATLRLNYFDEELNGLDENSLVLWKSDNLSNWIPQGFTTRDAVANYVEATGIDRFSRWTLTPVTNPLPLQFLGISAQCATGSVVLRWSTAQEQNTGHFIVERSAGGTAGTGGTDWAPIGTVAAAGNSTGPLSYSFTDAAPLSGNVVYRIAEVDLDGRQQLSRVVAADCSVAGSVRAWPNPVRDVLWVEVNCTFGTAGMLRVYDSKGGLLGVQQQTLTPGVNRLSVGMAAYAPGVYHIELSWDGGGTKTIEVIKVNN
jgi:hypothetical protein